ncbi:MAG: preprotein translocase subunit SecE [Oscillospiraceae bacterium]|nr:preprotein translocase subunit SecE [Oscillospiraceae bacterium]
MSKSETIDTKKNDKNKVSFTKKIVRSFKDLKGEFKKIVWPTKKQVLNNTFVVCVVMIISAAFIFGLDTLLGFLVNLILR